MFGNTTTFAHPIKHFYPICIQDFHKFARFPRSRWSIPRRKYAMKIFGKVTFPMGRLAWTRDGFVFGVATKKLLPPLFDATRFVCSRAKDRSRKRRFLLTNLSFFSSRERNGRSSWLRAVGRSETFGDPKQKSRWSDNKKQRTGDELLRKC